MNTIFRLFAFVRIPGENTVVQAVKEGMEAAEEIIKFNSKER
jgi:hypothetical protein